MRITVELDERQPVPVVKTTTEATTTSASEMPAISAGGPPEGLLQTLGAAPAVQSKPMSVPGSPEASADAMLAGKPPDWLVQAIESATPFRLGKF